MKGTIIQFVRGGDGSATITVRLQAERPGPDAAADAGEGFAKSVAAFEADITPRYEAFKAGETEMSLDLGSAKPAPAPRRESVPKPERGNG
jgi:hypothetical protein